MAKKQTRRSISVRGTTYAALLADCTARKVSVSDHLEQLIAADRAARGLPAMELALPAESKIVAGPPPEQTAMLGRQETPPPRKESQRGAALRPIVHASAQYGLLRRQAKKAPPPIPVGRDVPSSSGHASARPAHGDRVPPPVPGRGPANVVSF